MTAKTYDPKCYDLAAIFLGDVPEKHTPENIDKLAAHIQTEIEDWIEFVLPASALPRAERSTVGEGK